MADLMIIDRGHTRETTVEAVVVSVDGVAGFATCIECDGTLTFEEPDGTIYDCVECKGSGIIWVSI